MLFDDIIAEFLALAEVPRPSFFTERVQAYLLDFAKVNGLEAEADRAGNVRILKPASAGCENEPILVLQAHTDMVAEKADGVEFDFRSSPLKLVNNGSQLKADGTTLGADNGIGVAAILAVLRSKSLSHPAIEALFTANEEVGMLGAFALEPDFLCGKSFINLDSEEEGKLFVSCAGGATVKGTVPFERAVSDVEMTDFKISVSGLKGGHSGLDIHLPHANAIKVLASFLMMLKTQMDGLNVKVLEGGSAANAIPRNASVVLSVAEEDKALFEKVFADLANFLKAKYSGIEPDFKIEKAIVTNDAKFIEDDALFRLLNVLLALPDGALYKLDGQDTTDTSNNVSLITTREDCVEITSLCRSITESRMKEVKERVLGVLRIAGADIAVEDEYCGWQPDMDSPLLAKCRRVYSNTFGCDAKVEAMHAGLECGIIKSRCRDLDMVSFGPTIRYPHSPNEYVELESVKRFGVFLEKLLEDKG